MSEGPSLLIIFYYDRPDATIEFQERHHVAFLRCFISFDFMQSNENLFDHHRRVGGTKNTDNVLPEHSVDFHRDTPTSNESASLLLLRRDRLLNRTSQVGWSGGTSMEAFCKSGPPHHTSSPIGLPSSRIAM